MAASPAPSSASRRRKNIKRSTTTAARSAKPSRSPTTARRRGRCGGTRKQTGQDAALGKTTFVTSSASTAQGAPADLVARADAALSISAPKAKCCAPPRGLSRSARIDADTIGKEFEEALLRFRRGEAGPRGLCASRTFIAIALGIVAFFVLPGSLRLVTRLLISWTSSSRCIWSSSTP